MADTFMRKFMEGLLSPDGIVYVLVGFVLPLTVLLYYFSTHPAPGDYPEALVSLLFPR